MDGRAENAVLGNAQFVICSDAAQKPAPHFV
jgi:hypothetical protein